jgi:Protein of unknown function (DUF2865)
MSLRGYSAKRVQWQERTMLRVWVCALAAGLLTLAAPASAQGLFERIFGGLRHALETSRAPTNIRAFADPSTDPNPPPRAETGLSKAYCVRTCDGHFFPVQSHVGMSAAESCHRFCPASQTRLYTGVDIDSAVARDGGRYADLASAFVYRQRLVDACTCNGRDQFGLAPVDVNTDPTLRPGDVVATKMGLVAVTGVKNKTAEFTPIGSSRNMPKSYRDRLSGLKVMRPNQGATATVSTVTPLSKAQTDDRQSAQLAR